MTPNQRTILLALNLRAMQMETTVDETGVFSQEVAEAAESSTRSAAVTLAQMRDFGWVRSLHGCERVGWALTAKGVEALEANR